MQRTQWRWERLRFHRPASTSLIQQQNIIDTAAHGVHSCAATDVGVAIWEDVLHMATVMYVCMSHNHVTCVPHMSHIVSPVQQRPVCEMLQHLSELGSLPHPAADTHFHYQSRQIMSWTRRPTTPMTSIWGQLWNGRANNNPPHPRGSAH